MSVWLVDRIAHWLLPLIVAVDAVDDAVVYVSPGARLDLVHQHALRHGARLQVERRRASPARDQLVEYLDGRRAAFDVRLRPLGSAFQRRAWEQLQRIEFGTTCSYSAQAAAMGVQGGARAVGRANAMNPISIIVPCHRVVGSTGAMTGFGGGIETKRWLLALERTGQTPTWSPHARKPAKQLGLFGASGGSQT